jgi:hypothetical protein
MKACALDETALQQLAAEVARLAPLPHHTSLLAVVNGYLTDCAFQFALTQDGWYRPGGVIRPDGTRITDDLEAWAENQLERCNGDMSLFVDLCLQDELLATRLIGKMHYLVAPYGPGPTDFLQMEVEELQEVLDRYLIDRNQPPTDLSELTDPVRSHTLSIQAVSRPNYHLRQVVDMRSTIVRLTGPDEPEVPMQRFLNEWVASRAGANSHFSAHWVMALREHADCYCQTILTATPLSRHARKLRYFHWEMDSQGVDLAQQLMHFDRVAGYPFAWYFHLTAGALTPHYIALKVKQDLEDGYRYLAEPDLVVFEGWLNAPYTI